MTTPKNVLKTVLTALLVACCLAALGWTMAGSLSLRAINAFRLTNGFVIVLGLAFLIIHIIRSQRASDERLTTHRSEVKKLIADALEYGESHRADTVRNMLEGQKELAEKLAEETKRHSELVAKTSREQTNELSSKLDTVIQAQQRTNGGSHDPV